jgi:two-component system sensor histidine kinase KdpD
VYVLVVLGASAAGGRALGLTVSALAFLGFNYLFLPPYYTLVIADPLDWLVLVVFAVTGAVAAQLLYRAQSNTDAAIARAQEVDRLAALGAETLAAASASDGLLAIAAVIRTTLGAHEVAIYRRGDSGVLQRATSSVDGMTPEVADPVSSETVSWFNTTVPIAVVLADGTTRLDPAVITGLTLRQIYRRLDVRNEPVGVLHVRFAADTTLTHDRTRLLDALAYYAALGVERVRLEATAEHAEAERRMESLRTALLMSVSHDLRTPLTTIKALAHELGVSSPSTSARVIEAEADRLDALVGDLLDLSRLQAGAMPAQRVVNTVDDLIGAALQRAHGALTSHAVAVSLPDDMLVATFDLSHSVRVLVNLLENAAKYAPAGSAIEVSARHTASIVIVEVADEGPGVPATESDRIFEPFYRPTGTPPDVRGTGLGLSIARGLCEAQGGWLRYRPRPTGGSIFSFALPSL